MRDGIRGRAGVGGRIGICELNGIGDRHDWNVVRREWKR